MSKNLLVAGIDCDNCVYVHDINKNKISCELKDREYYIGQYVPCDKKEVINEGCKKN